MPAKRSFMRPKWGSNLGRTSRSCRNLNMPVMITLPLLLLLPILWSTKLCSFYPVQAGALTQRSEEQSAWDLIITRLLDGKLKMAMALVGNVFQRTILLLNKLQLML